MLLIKKAGSREKGTRKRRISEALFFLKMFMIANGIILIAYLVQILNRGEVKTELFLWVTLGLNGLLLMILPVKWLNDNFAYFAVGDRATKHQFRFPTKVIQFGGLNFGYLDAIELKVDEAGSAFLLMKNVTGSKEALMLFWMAEMS